jgi:phosphoribosylaminoimidazolecarboxamide formyltransferase/IMP cyclohydrolase
MRIKTALISVSDKSGLVPFAKTLVELGIEILSTGGTAAVLKTNKVPVTKVSDYTQSPEILDGRVKTLHPRIHGGILARQDDPSHQAELEKHAIKPIGLVVCNLYPFIKTVSSGEVSLEAAIEQIDIGGPTMLRAAAKNSTSVTVSVDPDDYPIILAELETNEGTVSSGTRHHLAVKAFHHTASYDTAIALYLGNGNTSNDEPPITFELGLKRVRSLRYGENPHQKAALYAPTSGVLEGFLAAHQHQGKELSFNNLVDAQAAWQLCSEFGDSACAIIKHTNPCGVATAATVEECFRLALECDPVSAFGSVIAFNREVDRKTAEDIGNLFVELIIAPRFSKVALEYFSKKKNLRLLELPHDTNSSESIELKSINGGFLGQSLDNYQVAEDDLTIVTEKKPDEEQMVDLLFAWKVCKHVKSNAIVMALNCQTTGIGAGQMSRVDSVQLAVQKANLSLSGGVLASDAFFPFRDGIDAAAKVGIRAVIQPGGSIRDPEVIDAANQHGIAMVHTGIRHFRH